MPEWGPDAHPPLEWLSSSSRPPSRDPSVVGVSPREVAQRLKTATPSIILNQFTGAAQNPQGLPMATNSIIVEMWMLEPGQEVIVGRQLHKVLTNPKSVGEYTPAAARMRG